MNHGHGMAEDLPLLARLATRRNALRLAAGVGAGGVVLATGANLMRLYGPLARTAPPHEVGGLFTNPDEIGGPFPADGTNHAEGATSNVLSRAGVVRGDITRSFIGSTMRAAGVPMNLELALLGVDRGGAGLAGHAVYAWNCDAAGHYSLYGEAAGESWLRGVQVADAGGRLRFRTVFPGAYEGRWPHIHLEIHRSLDAIARGAKPLLTTQLIMPEPIASRVYAAGGYEGSGARLAKTPLARDLIFGESSVGEIAQQTPRIGGGPNGLVATARVGVAGATA